MKKRVFLVLALVLLLYLISGVYAADCYKLVPCKSSNACLSCYKNYAFSFQGKDYKLNLVRPQESIDMCAWQSTDANAPLWMRYYHPPLFDLGNNHWDISNSEMLFSSGIVNNECPPEGVFKVTFLNNPTIRTG